MNQDILVTGMSKPPDWAVNTPCVFSLVVTDSKGIQYSADIEFLKGYSTKEMREAMVLVFKMCENTPVAVHVDGVIPLNQQPQHN